MKTPKNTDAHPKAPGEFSKAKMMVRLTIYAIVLGVILFLSAGRTNWGMGWSWLGLHFIVLVINTYVFPIDPDLIDERTQIKEGVKSWDKWLVVSLQIFMPFGILVLAGLDQRYDWSQATPFWLQIIALALTALGYLLSMWAAAVNKFYGRFVRIQKERGHYVIDKGPYGWIRHPGYVGIAIFMLATALALDSLWTLSLSGALTLALIIRTALEDKTLQEELEGYKEYTQKVRYRLIPGIW